MRIRRFERLEEFQARAEAFLVAHEAAHCLQLGILATLLAHPDAFGAPPYLATVEKDDAVIAVALRTPPNNLLLSLFAGELDEARAGEALALLARDLHAAYGALPGAQGPNALAHRFAVEWSRLTGAGARRATEERIYALDAVQPVPPVAGALRAANEADRALLVAWIAAFTREALGDGQVALDAETWVERALTTGQRRVYLWEDGAPVTLAGVTGHTPHGIRVGPVYTPPEARRKGYATACVAALSRRMLDEGRRSCYLFTDLSNQTSNHIYQEIGYRPVADVDIWVFEGG